MKRKTTRSPLRVMRDKTGLTAQQVAPLLAAKLGRASYHYTSVIKAEKAGIRNWHVIKAYAEIYQQQIEDVFAAASAPNNL